MEKVAVIVGARIVDNYSLDSKKPFCWNFTLNYLIDNTIKSVVVKYDGDIEFNSGNVVLYNFDSNNLFEIENLSLEQVRELEFMREVYRVWYNSLIDRVNVSDSKLDNATVKFFNHKNRVSASFDLDVLKRILNNLDRDIDIKKNFRGR